MNVNKRIKMVKAMEFIIRNINNESQLDLWLSNGVADGDIEYGDLTVKPEDAENLEIYIKDADYKQLMRDFLYIMSRAYKSGGLYSDGVTSD